MRRLIGAASLLALSAGLALNGGPALAQGGEGQATTISDYPEPSTLSGAYLAGAFALSEQDLDGAARYMSQALARDPGNATLTHVTFQLLVRAGRVFDAVPLAGRLLVNRPDDTLAHLVLLLDDVRAGDLAGARDHIDRMESGDVETFALPLVEAWIHAGLGDLDRANAVLDGVAETPGLSGLVNMHRGMILDMDGQWEEARTAMERAIGPGLSLRLVQALGSLYERLSEWDKARELYTRYAEENPSSVLIEPALARTAERAMRGPLVGAPSEGIAEVMFQISSALQGEGALDRSLVYARLAQFIRPDFALGQILVGDLLVDMNHTEDALHIYDMVDEAAPESWSARLKLGRALERLERYEESLRLMLDMAAERPERAEPLITVGDIHRSGQRFEEAVEAYDDARARSPDMLEDDWTFFYRRGIALERASQWPRAEADLQQAISLNPDNAHLLNYLGYSWLDRGENIEEAEAMIRRAVDMLPNDGYIVDSLGWVYFRTGRLNQAVELLERAVELEPNDAVINDHLGDAYWM
ncbi:MAG: tetratricopeptide repeat protein, partial [Alphaproteobacteria bacterium]|nr:tetratricopeptide repeat protein [Alphaproteobacteria bacterium]